MMGISSSDVRAYVPFGFEIPGMITMPEMLRKGYTRAHVKALFEELSARGFGTYERGGKGPGNCAKFTPNEKCPKKYMLMVDARTIPDNLKALAIMPKGGLPADLQPVSSRGSRAKQQAPVAPVAPVAKSEQKTPAATNGKGGAPAAEQEDGEPISGQRNPGEWNGTPIGMVSDWLRGLTRTVVRDSQSAFVGYECCIYADEILVVYRVKGGGVPTMQEALRKVWKRIEGRVGYKHKTTAGTKPFDAVMSRLMARGFHILDRPEAMGYDVGNDVPLYEDVEKEDANESDEEESDS